MCLLLEEQYKLPIVGEASHMELIVVVICSRDILQKKSMFELEEKGKLFLN